MAGDIAYFDTSAFLKLIFDEAESSSFRSEAQRWPVAASAGILEVEAIRAARRADPVRVEFAERLLITVDLIPLDRALLRAAADLGSPLLRSLDAVHLAAARTLGADLGILFTYDHRMRDAAVSLGLPIASPTWQGNPVRFTAPARRSTPGL